jgi:hypothetical protein
MNVTDFVRLVVERFDAAKKDGQQYEVIKYAIRSEAKFNKLFGMNSHHRDFGSSGRGAIDMIVGSDPRALLAMVK